MKRMILLLAFVIGVSGCLQDDIDKAVNECRVLVEEAQVEAWELCSSYFENDVIPRVEILLEEKFQELYDQAIEAFEQQLQLEVEEFMVDLGCYKDPLTLRWNCSGSSVCE